jgi:hypothetical protein
MPAIRRSLTRAGARIGLSDDQLERFLLRVALPPTRLGLDVKRLRARRADPAARVVAIDELRRAARVRARLAR